MHEISFGSDPEFMLTDGSRYQSAIGIVPGTSKKRYHNNGNYFYYDNVLAECAIKPGYSKDEVIQNFKTCFKTYAELVHPYKISVSPWARYPFNQLNHKDARKIGCDEEHCAYEISTMKPPKLKKERTAGGHIHIGCDGYIKKKIPNTKDGFVGLWDAAKVLDIFLGYVSLFLDHHPDAGKRKSLFGKAGRYRRTSYGIEYRTLSNFWLESPKLVGLMYDLVSDAIKFLNNPNCRRELWEIEEDKILFVERAKNAYKFKYKVEELKKAINTHHINYCDRQLNDLLKTHCNISNDIFDGKYSEKYDFYKEWQLND